MTDLESPEKGLSMQGCLDPVGPRAWLCGTVLVMLYEVERATHCECHYSTEFGSLTYTDGKTCELNISMCAFSALNCGCDQLLQVSAALTSGSDGLNLEW